MCNNMCLLLTKEQIPSIVDKISFVIQMASKCLKSNSIGREPPAKSRQFSAYEAGLLND
jgi:hypothetical protein